MNSPMGNANVFDPDEVHIYVHLNYDDNNVVHHAEASNSQRRRQHHRTIDLNGQAEEGDGHAAPVDDMEAPDAAVDAPVEDYTGSSFGTNYEHGGYIDWNCGSIDVAPDGRLSYCESAPTTLPEDAYDLKAAVQEAQDQDDAFFEERLENLQAGGDVQQKQEEYNFDLNFIVEENYYPLWYHN